MCSEADFKNHPSPHILPLENEMDEKEILPLEDTDDIKPSTSPDSLVAPDKTGSDDPNADNGTGETNQSDTLFELQTKDGSLKTKVVALNESIQTMVDHEILETGDAYLFLSAKLTELTEGA
jgi:hypothetical protein